MALLNRLPKIEQITPVYSVGVTILFSWAIVTTIEVAINNWALYFGVADILSLFAYVMAGAFLESLLLISSLLMLSFILPQKIFGNKFVLQKLGIKKELFILNPFSQKHFFVVAERKKHVCEFFRIKGIRMVQNRVPNLTFFSRR